ncbi:acyl- synthetase family member mitochondrial [Brachionus plicatilis]|uniref:Acyl-synthetase family member mitochondrial n=1 Tax=Brachionus plicatilis TaxID=10195 RepID=A0A3M7R633_BRAPC|nr:acyl- synthetase family member mitochondrial [Brachionus plicatilis]
MFSIKKYLVPITKFTRCFSSKSAFHSPSDKIFLNDKYSKFSFNQVYNLSNVLSKNLLDQHKKSDLNGEKIAVLCSNNYTYLISCLAVWMSNGVPLGINKNYPINLIEYFINDSKCKLVINGTSDHEPNQTELNNLLDNNKIINFHLNESSFFKQTSHPIVANSFQKIQNLLDLEEMKQKEGVILYTSGTSGPPKGVVLTRYNILRTIQTLVEAWQISPNDSLLHVLPLNHVHGLIYCLLTYLYAGCHVDMLPKFEPLAVWEKLLNPNNNINSFMAVPTIYVQLVNYYLNNEAIRKKYPTNYIKDVFKSKIRLVVSGSAPLNVKTHREWNEITGYNILERYGMTEIGLGLSNPFVETEDRKRVAGAVGRPFGNTNVRIVEPNDTLDSKHVLVESGPDFDKIFDQSKSLFGELQIKGDMVFKKYLNKPEQTKETFSDDGWFKTGDTAEFLKDEKIYKLIGRTSVDVIKSGGYKISALDIEKELLGHDLIDDVTVIGLQDPVWGQKVFALIVLKEAFQQQFCADEFKKWCKQRLPKQSVPKAVKVIEKMPRNQLGKVNKKELIKIYEKENG